MYRISILSVITASLLLVGCSEKPKENKESYPKTQLQQEGELKDINQTKEHNQTKESNQTKEPKVASSIAIPKSKEKPQIKLQVEQNQSDTQKLVLAEESVERTKELSSDLNNTKIIPITEVTPVTAVTPVVKVVSVEKIVITKPVTPVTPIKVTDSNTTSIQKSPSSEKAFDYKLEAKEVSTNVWCFFGALEGPTKENAGNMVNSCYIKTNDGYLVMDTGPSYQFAKQSYEVMQKIEDLPVKYVVNSHEHDDHWLGNDFYKQKFGTYLIGPESINSNYKDGDKTRMYKVLPANAIEGTRIIKLDKTPKEPYTLNIGGEEFKIIPMDTQAHTGDDIFIYMPKRKVLFAGDLVMNGRITSNRHGSVIGQLKALAMMKKLDWNIMVPGHGFITDATAMDEAELYFNLTKERVLKAIEEGVDATKINEVVKLIEFKDKAMYDILNPQNIAGAFEELEMLEDE